MKAQRVIARRGPSGLARHCDVSLSVCRGVLEVRTSLSAIRGYDALVLYRCPVCDGEAFATGRPARAVEVRGVLPPEAASEWRDIEDDVDDRGAYGV